ncbi:uncharacterized protein PgNI_09177 [Pyricularia grisea]|uniref:Cytochrome P450 n=1 Tax=Pyricularia grisea TaxID=148305 RepID=A0A6P8ASV1_PYRGI|nr:uncharacterized protein PgNI_09177 [Pyricularia grisea]TLD05201.1 hypothetical protein PgNI_09177 [Pyricularia grisea]
MTGNKMADGNSDVGNTLPSSTASSTAKEQKHHPGPRRVASSMLGRLCPVLSSSTARAPPPTGLENETENDKEATTTTTTTTMAKDAPPKSEEEKLTLVPIPEPKGLPVLGHVTLIDKDLPVKSYYDYAQKMGPIYKMSFFTLDFVILSNHELTHEVCDDKRFKKCIENEIAELRWGTGDGLFTSRGEEEENWGIAHRVLVPAFGPLTIRNMFPEMHDIASQLALKWARHGAQAPINIAEDFTRLAMDTIALCAMGFRFNSYYRSDVHPFIDAMYSFLRAAGLRITRPPGLPALFFRKADKKFAKDIALLRETAEEVIRSRNAEVEARGPGDGTPPRKDLLTAMLEGVDKKTGKKMTEDSIVDNLITFLIAGHETTASTLAFTVYRLLAHPEVYRKAQDEIDQVVGKGELTINHLAKLKYISAVIRETMRFNPPIPFLAREALTDTVVGGKYPVKAGLQFATLIELVQRDPAAYGADADEFKPERMLDGPFDERMKKFPHCWMPFGTGVRACIGRPFAWQEMLLALALLLQNFKFVKHDPGYELKVSQTLTLKPDGFVVRAMLRDCMTPGMLESRLAGVGGSKGSAKQGTEDTDTNANPDGAGPGTAHQTPYSTGLKPLTVLYGSNSGTCEFMAQRLAADAARHGFAAAIDTLDAATEALPTDRPVVIITASYEGEPTHNAAHFAKWLESLAGKTGAFRGVRYAVFGCGHRDWVKTFHKVPKMIDERLAALGAERLVEMGCTDAKERDMFSDFEAWEDDIFWPAVGDGVEQGRVGGSETTESSEGLLQVTLSTPRATILHQDVQEAKVVSVRALTHRDDADGRTGGTGNVGKGHVEVQLPPGTQYCTGDYLAVLPHNPRTTVARVMRRFGLAWDAHASIRAPGPTVLPTGGSVPVAELLTSYVELGVVASRRNILTLAGAATDPAVKAKLENLASDGYEELVKDKQLSVLSIAEQFPDLEIPLGTFITLLPPMRVRQYSISSSPLANPTTASITYSVLDSPSTSGHGRHVGVCSSYLATLEPGQKVQVSVRPGAVGFRPPPPSPSDAAPTTPVVMIAAGTGIAPFRAFLQERAEMLRNGRVLAPAVLFFGCRGPGDEDLYRDELDAWEEEGVLDGVFRAYSRDHAAEGAGCRYVQDRVRAERRRVGEMWEQGARVYVCGSAKMGEGVKDAMLSIIIERSREANGEEMGADEAEEYFQSMRNQRYAVDVFD